MEVLMRNRTTIQTRRTPCKDRSGAYEGYRQRGGGGLASGRARSVILQKRLHAKAEHIYADSLMLLPKVEEVNERRRLEERVKLRGEILEQRAQGGWLLRLKNGAAV
jgi:hypothetical protein